MTEKAGFTDEAEAAVLTPAACGEDGDSSAQVPRGGEQVGRGCHAEPCDQKREAGTRLNKGVWCRMCALMLQDKRRKFK